MLQLTCMYHSLFINSTSYPNLPFFPNFHRVGPPPLLLAPLNAPQNHPPEVCKEALSPSLPVSHLLSSSSRFLTFPSLLFSSLLFSCALIELEPVQSIDMRSDARTETLKFLCSYSGKILPRQTDGKLRYVGGITRVLAVDPSISFSELMVKLGEFCGSSVTLKCQLPGGDLETLISITSDEDLANIVEEYDRASSSLSHPLKIRATLSPPKSLKQISPPPSTPPSVDFAFPKSPCHGVDSLLSSPQYGINDRISSPPYSSIHRTSSPPVKYLASSRNCAGRTCCRVQGRPRFLYSGTHCSHLH